MLTDDNFCSIVNAVEKGRSIYAGIQKFVAFIMSVHIAEVMQIFVCIVAGVPVMRTPLQILFLILVTDLPPSIALGMEPGEPGILKLRLDTFLGAGTQERCIGVAKVYTCWIKPFSSLAFGMHVE